MVSVNVLMSTYNGEKYLSQQIESIINQKGNFDLRLIIRDDGSTDSTPKILEKYAKKYPKIIFYYLEDNKGYNFAFFELLRFSPQADFYAFSDQDDVWIENKLDFAIKALQSANNSIPLLYSCSSFMVYDDLKPYAETRKKVREIKMYNSLIQNICPGHNDVFNDKLATILKNPIDSNRVYVYDSWVSNVANLFGTILFDNQSHTYYRQHNNQKMGYGRGRIGNLATSGRRVKKGDGIKFKNQIIYFSEVYEQELKTKGYYKEIENFLKKRCFINRFFYFIFSCKLYRQRPIETIAFRIAAILNKI